MPLAVVCSWLGCQRAPCETPDPRRPPTKPSDDSRDLRATAFVQPPLGCDVRRPRERRSDPKVPRARVTGTVGLCQPAVCGCASSSVSEGLMPGRRCRRMAQGSRRRDAGRPFVSGPVVSKQRHSIDARLLSARRPKRSVHGCSLSPPPSSPLPALPTMARTSSATTHHVTASRIRSTFRR